MKKKFEADFMLASGAGLNLRRVPASVYFGRLGTCVFTKGDGIAFIPATLGVSF